MLFPILASIVASLKSSKVAQDESGVAEIIFALAFLGLIALGVLFFTSPHSGDLLNVLKQIFESAKNLSR
jgi:D-alanyl-lipoteichoic acid acyltransferase DltB (MBOAT superfamily)